MSAFLAPSSTRATSESRTTRPGWFASPFEPGSDFTITWANASASGSRPSVVTGTCSSTGPAAGSWPSWPAATCTFCSRSARTTSPALRPRLASASGSSQTRIA